MEPISIQEAHDQLQACGDEVNRIKAKLSELQAENSVTALARRERELADQLLEGGDVATIRGGGGRDRRRSDRRRRARRDGHADGMDGEFLGPSDGYTSIAPKTGTINAGNWQ
jgi:hypothetical protein